MNIYQSNTYRKYLSWLHFDDETRVHNGRQLKDQNFYISVSVVYLTFTSSSKEHPPRLDNSIPWTFVWYLLGTKDYPRRKKLHRNSQGTNFLRDGISNRVNVRAPIQFRRKRQPQYLERCFCYFKSKPINFHINITKVIRQVRQNKLSFLSIEIRKALPARVYSVLWIGFKFRSQI